MNPYTAMRGTRLRPNTEVQTIRSARRATRTRRGVSIGVAAVGTTALLLPAAGGAAAAGALGAWAPGTSLVTARYDHTATLLPTGNVLVAGGLAGSSSPYAATASAELINPTTGTSTATGSLGTARYDASSGLLASGDVVVAGGASGTPASAIATSELYNPSTATFSPTTSPMPTAVFGASSVVLGNGMFLVVGGDTGSVSSPTATNAVSLYNPAAGSWTAAAPLATARAFSTSTLLPGGDVLVAGGTGPSGAAIASAELYDPTTGAWSTAGTLSTARSFASAQLLSNGLVLVAGGRSYRGDPTRFCRALRPDDQLVVDD